MATLTNPASLSANSMNVFTAPEGTTLDSDTAYYISVNEGVAAANRLTFIRTNSEDEDGETGWSIGNSLLFRDDETDSWSGTHISVMIRIRGTVTPNSRPTSEDAEVTTTLNTPYIFATSDFSFSDEDEGETLQKIRIATLPDKGGLALNAVAVSVDGEITPADMDNGHFQFTPETDGEGTPYTSFTFKVNDGTGDSHAAYTMSIDVAGEAPNNGTAILLVRNTDQTQTSSSDLYQAQGFETGTHTDGYTISDVSLKVGDIETGDTTTVRIREASGNEPGATDSDIVATLTNPPSLTANSINVFTAPEGTTLDSDTTYFISVNEGVAAANRLTFGEADTNLDNGAAGWSIENGHLRRNTENIGWDDTQAALMIRIRGSEAPGRGTYGDPIKAHIEVNSGWQSFKLETRVAEDWFRTTLENNKQYYIRINTTPNTPRPRLTAAYDPDGNQHTHGSGADCENTRLGRSCAGHGWFHIDLEEESHRHGNFHFYVDAPHSIRPEPDEDFEEGANPYTCSVMVESTTDRLRRSRSAPPSPLRGFFYEEPEDHNGSDPFEMELAFDDSIRGDGDDISAALTITNGSLTTITQNEWAIEKWDLTVTPTAAADITIELAASVPCDEDGAICTLIGRRFSQAIETSIGYTPPPPTISSVSLVTDAGDNDAWDTDELVTADVVFTGPVYIQGQPTLGITLTGTRHEAAYASGDGSSTLRFSHRITSEQNGAINASLVSDGLNTTTGAIFDAHAQLAVLDFDVDESAALTGQFQNAPANHNGASERFTFNIQFSLDPVLNASDVRDDIFTVTNGDVKKVQRTNRKGDNRNSRWLIRVKPDGEEDVTLTIPVTINCEEAGALCTSDEIKFSEEISLTVPRTAPVVTNSDATGAPTITGTVQTGETLTAGTSGIADADGLTGVAYTYQWSADNVDISGATGSTYTLTSTDQAKAIKVTVSFTDDAGNAESLTSAATGTVAAAPVNNAATGQPTISGSAVVGSTLTADTTAITDPDGTVNATFTYQWRRAGSAVANATSSTYTLTSDDTGNTMTVQVSFTDDDGNAESVTSAATATVTAAPTPNNQATGLPTITGDTTTGSTLTAVTSGISDADGMENAEFSYQWLRGDAAISGATGSTYTLDSDDVGNSIKVRVSFTDDTGNTETLTSAGSASITAPPTNSAATGQPTIIGSTTVGSTLTAGTSAISDSNGLDNASFSYQWLRDGAEISGATNSTYTVADADQGQPLKVRASFTDDDGFSESLTSAGLDIPQAVAVPPTAPTSLTGSVNTDGSITLTWSAPDDDSVTSYQILRRLPAEGEDTLSVYVDSTGGTATTYTDTDTALENTHYVYRVKARNSAGLSSRSNFTRVDK